MIRTSVKPIPRFSPEYMRQSKDFEDLLWNRSESMSNSETALPLEQKTKKKKKKKSKEKNASESEDIQDPGNTNVRTVAKKKSKKGKHHRGDADDDLHHVAFSHEVLDSNSSRIPRGEASLETEHLEIPSKKKKRKKRSLENCEDGPDRDNASQSSQLTNSESEVPKKKHKSKKHKQTEDVSASTEVPKPWTVQQLSELGENNLEILQSRSPSKKNKKRSENLSEDCQLPVSDNEVLNKPKKHKSKKRKPEEVISKTGDSNSPSHTKLSKAAGESSKQEMIRHILNQSINQPISSDEFENPIKRISQSDGAGLLTPRNRKSNSERNAESRKFLKENCGNKDYKKETAAFTNTSEDSSETPKTPNKRQSESKSKSPNSNQKSNFKSNMENKELSKESSGSEESVVLPKSPDYTSKSPKEFSKRHSKSALSHQKAKSPVSHQKVKSPVNNQKLKSKKSTEFSEDLDKSRSVEIHQKDLPSSDSSETFDSPTKISEKLEKEPKSSEKKKAPRSKSSKETELQSKKHEERKKDMLNEAVSNSESLASQNEQDSVDQIIDKVIHVEHSKVVEDTEELVDDTAEIVEDTGEIDDWLAFIKDDLIEEELGFEVSPLHAKFPLLKGLNKDQRQELADSGIPCRLRTPWSNKEDEILKRNMMEFQKLYEIPSIPFILGINANATKRPRAHLHKFLKMKKFTFFLGKDLDSRTLNNIHKRAHFLFHPMKLQCPKKKTMTKNELDLLFRLQSKVGNRWNTISEIMQKPGNNLYYAAKYHAAKKDTGPWTDEENASLLKAVKRYMKKSEDGQYKRLPWKKISKRVGTRTSEQCRSHWLHVLCWKFNHGDLDKPRWSPDDTAKLIALLYESNATTEREVDWDQLHQRFKCSASYGSVLGKWYNLKKQIPNVHKKDFEDNVLYLHAHYGKGNPDIQLSDQESA